MDLHEEAGKENEQTLANLSPAEEATKMKSKFMFLFLCFHVWPYNKHLINRAPVGKKQIKLETVDDEVNCM